jgi:hypothetical protein
MQYLHPQRFLSSKRTSDNSGLGELLQQGAVWRAETPQAICFEHKPAQTYAATCSSEQRFSSCCIPFCLPAIDEFLPGGGLSRTSIHEIFYNDVLLPHAVAHTLPTIIAYNAWKSQSLHTAISSWGHSVSDGAGYSPCIVWIGAQCWPTPFALSSYGANDCHLFMQHCLFIDPPDSASTLWAIETALRSRAVQLVIATCPSISRVTSQRLALAARSHETTALLLRDIRDLKRPSHCSSRWELSPHPSNENCPSWELLLHKLKGHASPLPKAWRVSLHDYALDYSSRDLPPHALRAHVVCTTQNDAAKDSESVPAYLSASSL